MTLPLSRDEMETHISQTAAERHSGVWHVYTDDPYWIRRMDERGAKLVKVEVGGGRHYEIAHRQITLRSASKAARLPTTTASDDSDGQCDDALTLDDLDVVATTTVDDWEDA